MIWPRIFWTREITGNQKLKYIHIQIVFSRLQRRAELSKATKVKAGLKTKQEYMESQLEQYKTYISHCLNNLNKAGNNKRVHFTTLYDDDQKSKAQKLRSKVNTLF